jgi:hypothetical protein
MSDVAERVKKIVVELARWRSSESAAEDAARNRFAILVNEAFA